jgi:hypothetical protein
MKFDEMTKKLFAGELVRRVDWKLDYHIFIAPDSITVDEDGFPYSFSRYDYEAEWEVYSPATEDHEAGTLLSYVTLDGEKKFCRVVDDNDNDCYIIVDVDDWDIYARGIKKHELDMFLDAYNLTREKVSDVKNDLEKMQRKFLFDTLTDYKKESMEAE